MDEIKEEAVVETPEMELVEDGIEKEMMITIDPATGEHKILGETPEDEKTGLESFDNLVDKINNLDADDTLIDNSPITDSESEEYFNGNPILNELGEEDPNSLDPETVRGILEVANKKIKGEKVNVYKELPQSIRDVIDNYVIEYNTSDQLDPMTIMLIKRQVADAIIDDFINDVQLNRNKNDFAKEIESIYSDLGMSISDAGIELIEERNKAYREAAVEIEDETKRQRLLTILDQIDEARNLTKLKEFAKGCKIKPIELEKMESRSYSVIDGKYKNSTNNIYDIRLANTVVARHLLQDGYTQNQANAFFIAFTKQIMNLSSSNPIDHAYMYYVLYYCALLDGDKSVVFKNNIKEVIDNLTIRNPLLKK